MAVNTPRIALIGYGAMARALIDCLGAQSSLAVGAVLLRTGNAPTGIVLVRSVEALLAWSPDLVVECAGQQAVRLAPTLLAHGIDTVIASVGALGDAALARELASAAAAGSSKLIIPAGAVGGLDALRAARLGGLDGVRYVGRKPPSAWCGTPAESGHDLPGMTVQEVVFEGKATDAITLFPKNANVTAAIALAGVGFDRTHVTLIADPAISRNQHEIEAEGSFGHFRIVLENYPLATNPKTSQLAALSVALAVIEHFPTAHL